MSTEDLLARISPLEQKRINAAKSLGYEFAGADWHYCSEYMDMQGVPSYADLLEKINERDRAEIDRLKAELAKALQDSARLDFLDSLSCAITIHQDTTKADSRPKIREGIDKAITSNGGNLA